MQPGEVFFNPPDVWHAQWNGTQPCISCTSCGNSCVGNLSPREPNADQCRPTDMKIRTAFVLSIMIVVSLIAIACSDSTPPTTNSEATESVAAQTPGPAPVPTAEVQPGYFETNPGCVPPEPVQPSDAEIPCSDFLELKANGDADYNIGDILYRVSWSVEDEFVRVGGDLYAVEGSDLRETEYGALYLRQ